MNTEALSTKLADELFDAIASDKMISKDRFAALARKVLDEEPAPTSPEAVTALRDLVAFVDALTYGQLDHVPGLLAAARKARMAIPGDEIGAAEAAARAKKAASWAVLKERYLSHDEPFSIGSCPGPLSINADGSITGKVRIDLPDGYELAPNAKMTMAWDHAAPGADRTATILANPDGSFTVHGLSPVEWKDVER